MLFSSLFKDCSPHCDLMAPVLGQELIDIHPLGDTDNDH